VARDDGDDGAYPEEGKVMSTHTVNIPSMLLDVWIPKLTAEEGILLVVLCRKTFGWDKMQDIISTSQLVAMTGWNERRVRRTMQSLLKTDVPVEVVGRGKHGTSYRIYDFDSDAGDRMQQTSLLHSDAGDRMQDTYSPLHSDASDRTFDVRTPVSTTTKNYTGVAHHVSEPEDWIPAEFMVAAASTEPPAGMLVDEPVIANDGGVDSALIPSQQEHEAGIDYAPPTRTTSGKDQNPDDQLQGLASAFEMQYESARERLDRPPVQAAAISMTEEELEDAWRAASENGDSSSCGSYGNASIVAQAPAKEASVEPVDEPEGMSWVDRVLQHIGRGEQDSSVIAAAVGKPVEAVERVMRTHPDVGCRIEVGRWVYFLEAEEAVAVHAPAFTGAKPVATCP
jgi:hypothetical protein